MRFFTQPIFLLLWATLLIYGVFIPLLGFYWDDLAIQWIAESYGSSGLARYFSTNRPVWGLFYQLNMTLLGKEPWVWQIFAIFWRWFASVGLYLVLKVFWKDRSEPALVGSLFFVVYPAFGGQFIATVFGHFFLVLSAFFFSLYFSLKTLKTSKNNLLFTLLAVLLSVVNVFSMEYFFLLELLRPVLFFIVLQQKETPWKKRVLSVFSRWIPYFVVFLSAGIWRFFIFNYQTENYTPKLIPLLKNQPLDGLAALFLNIVRDYWLSLIAAWGKIFQVPSIDSFGKSASLLTLTIGLGVAFLLIITFWLSPYSEKTEKKQAITAVVFGLFAILPAGVAFWLTDLPLKLNFPNDRFVIPYLFGGCLFLSGVLYWIPFKRWLRLSLVIFLIAGAATVQVRNGINFERDWEQQSRFFWQLSWRMPSIQPNTILYAPELPFQYFSDNSLTSTLNWMYDPTHDNENIPYILFYPSVRIGTDFETLDEDMNIEHDLLVGTFYGNTSQSIAIYYDPPSCFRVLDPEIEQDNWMVPIQVRQVLSLANPDYILLQNRAILPAYLYDPEPAENWCYYFQKADLARQFGDWAEVKRLGDLGFALDDNPNDPAERLPFIEGYAHTNDWDKALQLSQEAAQITPIMNPVLCNLWQRIDRETESSAEKNNALQTILNQLKCDFES